VLPVKFYVLGKNMLTKETARNVGEIVHRCLPRPLHAHYNKSFPFFEFGNKSIEMHLISTNTFKYTSISYTNFNQLSANVI